MTMKKLLFALLIAGASSSFAQYPEPTSLKGLKNLVLNVYTDRGISANSSSPIRAPADIIRERTVQKLKEADIVVLSQKESESLPNAPILNLNAYFQCESDRAAACGYHTDLELIQSVQLTRDPSITVKSITWRNSYTGGISKTELSTLPDLILVDAGALVIGFSNDYRTANPKR